MSYVVDAAWKALQEGRVTSKSDALFVGGPMDGEVRKAGGATYRVAVRQSLPPPKWQMCVFNPLDLPRPECGQVEYRLQRVTVYDRDVAVYVFEPRVTR
jgi:hypothetical protein